MYESGTKSSLAFIEQGEGTYTETSIALRD